MKTDLFGELLEKHREQYPVEEKPTGSPSPPESTEVRCGVCGEEIPQPTYHGFAIEHFCTTLPDPVEHEPKWVHESTMVSVVKINAYLNEMNKLIQELKPTRTAMEALWKEWYERETS